MTEFGECPLPLTDHPTVQLAHGGGGRLSRRLLEELILPAFGHPPENGHDAAVLPVEGERLAFTTDSYVVRPLFFPGGDIGKLAVCGTVNDLAVCGAAPRYLSVGFILEEGLEMEVLWRVARSMKAAADAAGARLVTGDTKVVDRGKGDGVYISTAGVGAVHHDLDLHPRSIYAGDALLVSGDLGRHGTAIMARRAGVEFETGIESDCAPLAGVVADLLGAGLRPHCLRDLTRGGLGTGLVELAAASGLRFHIDGAALPVREEVRGACELLGLDPLYVANEGCMLLVVPSDETDRTLERLRRHGVCRDTAVIGEVREGTRGRVTMTSEIGAERIVDMLSGEQLPRIC